jgi:hypothetical protein
MKGLILITVLMAFSGLSFAEEVVTDCPFMAEKNERENPKQNLNTAKEKSNKKESVQQ